MATCNCVFPVRAGTEDVARLEIAGLDLAADEQPPSETTSTWSAS